MQLERKPEPHPLDVYANFVRATEKRLDVALAKGWKIDHGGKGVLTPPANHEASRNHWAAHYYAFPYKDNVVRIPHWFWDFQ